MGNLKYKQSHRANGLCTQCSELVVPGYRVCWKHVVSHNVNNNKWRMRNADYMKRYMKKYRARMKVEGRCIICTAPLLQEDLAAGKVICENCGQRNYRSR